jgi:uncharacterized membrane protein
LIKGNYEFVAGLLMILGTVSLVMAGFYYSINYTGYWVYGWSIGRIISFSWLILSFLLAIIGVLLLVFSPSEESTQEQVQEE